MITIICLTSKEWANTCYVQVVFWKVFKNLKSISLKCYRLPLLEEHSNEISGLKWNSKRTSKANQGHLGTWALKTLGNFGGGAVENNLRHLGTQRVLEHSSAQTFRLLGTGGALFNRLFILGFKVNNFSKASEQTFLLALIHYT